MELGPIEICSCLFLLGLIVSATNAYDVVNAGGKALNRETDNRMVYAKFKVHKFSYLNITRIASEYVLRGTECGLACVNIPSCFSFNLAAYSNINDKVLCELLQSDIYNNSKKFVASHLFHHYSIKSPCISWPCQNNGICAAHYHRNGYVCVCADGFTGKYCETDIDECASNPCLNSGTCNDHVNRYSCSCKPGFAGTHCEEDIDECASNPCLNSGICNDHVNGYNCSCKPGFAGTHCEEDIDECASNPCLNSGTCNDHVNRYSCSCKPGFAGTHCEEDIDECASNPCLNSGICNDHVNRYSCSCKPGFAGTNCEEDIDECASNPCLNNGICNDQVNRYSCSCKPGFAGTHCEEDIDECASNPCLNSGICNDHVNRYSCSCKRGFAGTHCEEDPMTVTICEHNTKTIACNSGRTIDVLEAMYGRQNSYTCSNNGNRCRAANSYSVVYNKCQNRASCVLYASNNVFGDPCKGVGKYLFVKYQCMP